VGELGAPKKALIMLLFNIFFTGEERGAKRKHGPYSVVVVYEILSRPNGVSWKRRDYKRILTLPSMRII
jgi:hypothetical protein